MKGKGERFKAEHQGQEPHHVGHKYWQTQQLCAEEVVQS